MLTENEIKFLLWVVAALLSIVAFVGIKFIMYLMKLGNSIKNVEIHIAVTAEKHKHYDKIIDEHAETFQEHHKRIFHLEKQRA